MHPNRLMRVVLLAPEAACSRAMKGTMHSISKTTNSIFSRHAALLLAAVFFLSAGDAVFAQQVESSSLFQNSLIAESTLPEYPSAATGPLAGVAVDEPQATQTMDTHSVERPVDSSKTAPYASRYTKYIPAFKRGVDLSPGDKVVLGVKDIFLPRAFLGYIIAAGYSQAVNGQPNYGVDKGAFGERLAAAGVRGATEGLFSDAVFAPILHEDPRYYSEGNRYNLVHRTVYAVTRIAVTRTDSGRSTINGSLLMGYALAAGLTNAYYPAENRSFQNTATTFGGAIGGQILGNLLSEFADAVLQKVRLEIRP